MALPHHGEELSRRHDVETPEQVALGFEIADLGSRFLAIFVDGLILIVSLVALGLLFFLTTDMDSFAGSLGAALFIAVLFVVLWGYFVYFEAFQGGRTPGKRMAGIRVVHEGGYPLTLRGAAIRNLLRAIDVQPLFTCAVGGMVMMIHPRTQRLGDMAASTVVVRDHGLSAGSEERLWRGAGANADRRLLSEQQFAALSAFVERRKELSPDAAQRLETQLADVLRDALTQVDPAGRRTLVDRLIALHLEESTRREAAGAAVSAGSPLALSLVRAQGERWLEYRDLVALAQRRGLESLPARQLERFATLYRVITADLARARTYGASFQLVYSLERWVGAGHNLLYRVSGRSAGTLWSWLRSGFPSLVRARGAFVLAAALLLFVPAIASYIALRVDPVLARDIVPWEMIARAENTEPDDPYVDVPEITMPIMSSGIVANNVQVTFFVFAGGILAGIGTLFLLALNGVHLGSVLGLYDNEGVLPVILGFVAPHGPIELTAICIAGAAGLLLGSAIVAPGRLTRRDALAVRAREGVSLLAGTSLLLVLAGLTEGFVSPASIPLELRVAIGAAIALAVLAYLTLAGRGGVDSEATAPPGT